jgi:ubiquitin-like domain-containing CTD phosphatase 1
LKGTLYSLTNVPPERQKILGLVKGKLPPDQERIGDLKLVSGKKFTLVGTPEGDEIKDPSRQLSLNQHSASSCLTRTTEIEFLPDILNDLDVDFYADPAAAEAYKNDQRNIRKIKEMTQKLKLNIINPPRPGKCLLVLDIDYSARAPRCLIISCLYAPA